MQGSRERRCSAWLLRSELPPLHSTSPPLLRESSLQLSLETACRSLSHTLHSLALFLSREEFPSRTGIESCSAFCKVNSTHAILLPCELASIVNESNEERSNSFFIATSKDRGRKTIFRTDSCNIASKSLFVGVLEHTHSAERVHDYSFTFLRSVQIKEPSTQKEGPRIVQESFHPSLCSSFPSREGEIICACGSDCDCNRYNVKRDVSAPKKQPSEGWIGKAAVASEQAKVLMNDISFLERAKIGAGAGGIAGAMTYACLHPLDTVKTKLQTRGASDLYSGPLDVIVKTFKARGVLGFYSGISAVLVGSMFSSAVYFGTCELGKALFSHLPSCPPIAVPPLAGAMGNLVSSAILVPKEVITQRMQAGAAGRSWEVLVRTLEKEGFGGLYTGYSAALMRNLPASVLSFSSFEYLKSAWLRKSGTNRLEPWQSVISGALAGAISAALTTPLDVVKTRLMTQARSMSIGTGRSLAAKTVLAEAERQAKITAATYGGISSTLEKIWLEEGWIGLTKGVLPRILYSACFSALGYFAFETARLALVKHHIARKKRMLSLFNKQVVASHPLA